MITPVQDSSAIASRVLDAMPFAVIGLSRRDTVSFVNPAAETLLQRSAPLLRGRPLTDLLPPDAPLSALYGALAVKGLFGVLMILPVAALTWRALGDAHFVKGYQTKNVMRQMTVSLASAVAAVALQNGHLAQYSELAGRISPGNPAAMQWLEQTQHRFEQLGYTAGQAHGAAIGQLSALVERQAVFIACQHLYHWIAAIAMAAAVIVMVQKRLK